MRKETEKFDVFLEVVVGANFVIFDAWRDAKECLQSAARFYFSLDGLLSESHSDLRAICPSGTVGGVVHLKDQIGAGGRRGAKIHVLFEVVRARSRQFNAQ